MGKNRSRGRNRGQQSFTGTSQGSSSYSGLAIRVDQALQRVDQFIRDVDQQQEVQRTSARNLRNDLVLLFRDIQTATPPGTIWSPFAQNSNGISATNKSSKSGKRTQRQQAQGQTQGMPSIKQIARALHQVMNPGSTSGGNQTFAQTGSRNAQNSSPEFHA